MVPSGFYRTFLAAVFLVEEDNYFMHQTTLKEIKYKFGLHDYFESEEVGKKHAIYRRRYKYRGGTTIFIRVDEVDSKCVRIRFYYSKGQKVGRCFFAAISPIIILIMFLLSVKSTIFFALAYIAGFPLGYYIYINQRNRFIEDIPAPKT